jgi:hypothetical protein
MGALMQLIAYGVQDIYGYIDNRDIYYNRQQKITQEKNINLWLKSYKLLSSKNEDCPVTLDMIMLNSKYCICDTCKYNISASAIESILNTNTYNDLICPCCRSKWKNNIVYINGTMPISKLQRYKKTQRKKRQLERKQNS